VGGIEVDVAYPSSVIMPGSGFLPVNDPMDPTTLIVLLTHDPAGVDLYNGLQTLFDADTTPPFTLQTVLTLNLDAMHPERNLIFNQTVPFERARFTCTPGSAISTADFTCTVPQEVNAIGGAVPPEQRPPCELMLAAPS